MSVKNELSGGMFVIGRYIDSICARRFFNSSCQFLSYFGVGADKSFGKIKKIAVVLFRHYQYVARIDWFDIKNGKEMFILEHFIGGEFAVTNTAKNTLFTHGDNSSTCAPLLYCYNRSTL